jgi:hypothetical protein
MPVSLLGEGALEAAKVTGDEEVIDLVQYNSNINAQYDGTSGKCTTHK